MTDFTDIKRAIIDSLTPDLLTPQYRAGLMPHDPVETGHCAVASEAFYHLAGGKAAGFIPVVCGYTALPNGRMVFGADRAAAAHLRNAAQETHWWIRGPQAGVRGAGEIFDVTKGQYSKPFPYEKGHNTGFMQPQQKPSKRAQVIIDRVTEKLGAARLAAYRQRNIRTFQQKIQRQKSPTILRRA